MEQQYIEDISQCEVIYIGAPVILGNNVTRNDNTIGKIRLYW